MSQPNENYSEMENDMPRYRTNDREIRQLSFERTWAPMLFVVMIVGFDWVKPGPTEFSLNSMILLLGFVMVVRDLGDIKVMLNRDAPNSDEQ